MARFRGNGGNALELRRVEIENGARVGAIGMLGVLSDRASASKSRGLEQRPSN
jgi:hypothetical protein